MIQPPEASGIAGQTLLQRTAKPSLTRRAGAATKSSDAAQCNAMGEDADHGVEPFSPHPAASGCRWAARCSSRGSPAPDARRLVFRGR